MLKESVRCFFLTGSNVVGRRKARVMTTLKDTQHNNVLRVERKRNTLVVTPAGDGIGFRDADIQQELNLLLSLLDGPDFDNVVVDLGGANYFGTTIIGCITGLGRKTEETGGRLAVCNASEDMQGVMQVMHLDRRWPHFDSLRDALKSLK